MGAAPRGPCPPHRHLQPWPSHAQRPELRSISALGATGVGWVRVRTCPHGGFRPLKGPQSSLPLRPPRDGRGARDGAVPAARASGATFTVFGEDGQRVAELQHPAHVRKLFQAQEAGRVPSACGRKRGHHVGGPGPAA